MISPEEFMNQLIAEFEDVDSSNISPETNYREINNWSSMHALIIIAFIDANFDVQINANDLKGSNTIKDLYDIVITRISQ